MGNMFADFIGFVAAVLGERAFREELANASSFAYQRSGQVWDKTRLWYLHSVAAGAWGMITLVIVLLAAANYGVYSIASDLAIGTSDVWLNTQIIVAAVALLALVVCWVRLLPAKRIRNWSWINERTDEMETLEKARDKRERENASATELDLLRGDIEHKLEEFNTEFLKRYGKARSPMLSVLVLVVAPIVMGIGFSFVAVLLSTMNGVEWFQSLPIAVIGFACYLLGEILMRLFSGVLGAVLGDGGDALNRLANAMLIRPGLLILPFITEENYEKIMPKPLEAPFKKAADAVKGTTLSIRSICLIVIIWAILLPQVAILGLVALAGIGSYIIVVVHKERGLDPKNFVEGSSRLHLWFMMAILFFRIVQLVILGLWRLWWSGEVIWNPIAHWCNNLLGDGGLNWTTVGLVIFGAGMATFFAGKMKDMKHPFMVNMFRTFTVFFGLMALLPLIGWGLHLGGSDLRLPDMPSGRALAQEVSAETPPTPPPHEPDAIDRMRGAGTVVAPAPIVTAMPDLGTTGSVPPIPTISHTSAPMAASVAAEDRCDMIARTRGLTDRFREHMSRRYHCDE
ncbi:hypothetical protein K8R04_03965 [Candidatus Uhrbacteria bacterium]|nr:hypothetical protein [Candidatus Uhrbacteria bacterium]